MQRRAQHWNWLTPTRPFVLQPRKFFCRCWKNVGQALGIWDKSIVSEGISVPGNSGSLATRCVTKVFMDYSSTQTQKNIEQESEHNPFWRSSNVPRSLLVTRPRGAPVMAVKNSPLQEPFTTSTLGITNTGEVEDLCDEKIYYLLHNLNIFGLL